MGSRPASLRERHELSRRVRGRSPDENEFGIFKGHRILAIEAKSNIFVVNKGPIWNSMASDSSTRMKPKWKLSL